jgi:hypothetical protein
MAVRCKIFEHQRVHQLERMVNDFLDETGVNVVNATQSCDAHGNITLVVWYEEVKVSQGLLDGNLLEKIEEVPEEIKSEASDDPWEKSL